MKDKFKDVFKKMKPYTIPGVITLAIVLAILIFRGIWPFGSNRIDYFDNMQQVAPLYTHLWDWMHGDASLWFDWYTGLGTNLSMSMSAFSMLSPFNILLYLFPRNLILESISILTVFKMVFMSVAMYALLNKTNEKLMYPLKVTFSVMYAFCGYVILYGSCFTPWMDIVALFPLVMLGLYHMLKTGRKLFYIVMTGLIFIINYYLGAMILVYVFLVVGIYMLLKCNRSKWKEHSWNVGIGTVAGIGLSCFTLIPTIMQLSSSQRGGSDSGIVSQYIGWITGSIVQDGTMAAFQRWMMIYGMAFLLAVIVIGLKRYWSDKKERNFHGALMLMIILAMVVQGTNLMWHFGSYNGYTLRNGFLLAFTLIFVAAHYCEKMFMDIPIQKNRIIRQSAMAVVICILYAIGYNLIPENNEIIAIIFFMAVFITLFIVYLRKMLSEKDSFNYKTVIPLIAIEVFIGAYALIGPPKFYTYEAYQVGDYVQLANTAYEGLEIEDSATDRIINPDLSLNANYPLILRRGALSSFTAALEGDTQTYSKNWGYSKYFLWLLDSGGTVFTNSLIHVTEAVNQNDLDSDFYKLENTQGDYKLYSANYQLPFAITMKSSIAGEDLKGNWVSLHNKFYHAMVEDEEDLVSSVSYNVKRTSTTLTYNMDVNKNSAVYINIVDINNKNSDANSSWLISSMHIYVNDEAVVIPTIGDVNNTAYFTDYNNNLVCLGVFDDETINVRIEYDDPWYLKVSEITFSQLNMDKMASLCEAYENEQCEVSYTNDSLTVNVNATLAKNYVVLPVIYSDNWVITLNGSEVKGKSIAGLFTGIKVNSGDNEITMTFVPKGRKEGCLISLTTLLLIIVFIIINHFKKIKVWKWMKYCAAFIYLQLFNLVIVGMFLIPAIAAIPALIYQIILKIMTIL